MDEASSTHRLNSTDQQDELEAGSGNAPKRNSQSEQGHKPQSCFTCRRRKVKCDKKKPCENCVKMEVPCVFPTASRGKLLPPSSGLLETLQRLENMVKILDSNKNETQRSSPSLHGTHETLETGQEHQQPHLQPTHAGTLPLQPPEQASGHSTTDMHVSLRSTETDLSTSAGRLVRDQGLARYIRACFWDAPNIYPPNSIASDSEDDVDAENREDELSPDYAFILGIAPSSSLPTPSYRPPEGMRFQLWSIFKENVDPLVKVLHIPSLEASLLGALRKDQTSVTGLGALCLALFFGATTSISNQECQSRFAEERSILCARLRSSLEQLLSKCQLTWTDDIQVLQAFVLYLIFLRHHNAHLSWKLTGLAARLGQSLGLHRESNFGLSIFETEIRRRLWWQIAILEAPASEDYSSEYTLLEDSSFDAGFPTNLEDRDLLPKMTGYPPVPEKLTDMGFTLVRCEMTDVLRTIADSRRYCATTGKSFRNMTKQEQDAWVQSYELHFTYATYNSALNIIH